MRTCRSLPGLICLGGFALVLMATAPSQAKADGLAWCAHYVLNDDGGINCYFYTYEQCRAAVSGVGGICMANPAYTPARGAKHPPAKPARR